MLHGPQAAGSSGTYCKAGIEHLHSLLQLQVLQHTAQNGSRLSFGNWVSRTLGLRELCPHHPEDRAMSPTANSHPTLGKTPRQQLRFTHNAPFKHGCLCLPKHKQHFWDARKLVAPSLAALPWNQLID